MFYKALTVVAKYDNKVVYDVTKLLCGLGYHVFFDKMVDEKKLPLC